MPALHCNCRRCASLQNVFSRADRSLFVQSGEQARLFSVSLACVGRTLFPKDAHSVGTDISNYSNEDCERIVLKSRNKCLLVISVLPECILEEIRTGVSFVHFVVVVRKFHKNRAETVLTWD